MRWSGRETAEKLPANSSARPRIFGLAQESKDALLGVVHFQPLETLAAEVNLVEGRLGPVEAVQILHAPAERAVWLSLQRPPLQAGLVAPLALLAQLAAHEQQLLARDGRTSG